MIDLELAGVGVRLGVHHNAPLHRRPRRSGSDSLTASLPSALPPPAASSPSETGAGRRHRRRPVSSNCSETSLSWETQQQQQLSNVLRLSLRKPGDCQWQLRTSASSPALVVPAVQLYDHRGRLLIDTSASASPATSSPAGSRCGTYRSNSSTGVSVDTADTAGEDRDSVGALRPRQKRRRHHRHQHRCTELSTPSPVVDDAGLAMAPALRSLPLQQQPPPATGSDGDEDQSTATTAAATPATGRCRHHHHHHHHCRQQTTPVDGDEDDASASMGSSGSRQPPPGKPGLLGRRTQSSGSLCTADRLGRLLAPCGRHRHNHRSHYHNHDGRRANDGHADHHRHLRYKLCGSLPNHLDASQQDGLDVCDNNNITPASPAASEKDLLDLGYASERSPDEEKHFPGDMSGACESVPLQRGSRGLGLSVCGGADCSADGLVRIKRLFPHQPAWQSGRLRPGDVLLAVNGEPLSGLTNHEALEVLRTASDRVVLTVARPSRPPSWVAQGLGQGLGQLVGNGTASAAGRQLQPPQFLQLQPPGMVRQDSCGELEVSLSKVQGSLGFTLRKEDSSALGHYVRALVREPALSDGRIRPGDKIVAVNGVDICHLTHEEAVLFLRQAGDTVKLRLYRDVAQTPVSALSPTEAHKAFRPKTLRKEALDMLSDLAVRRMGPRGGAGGPGGPGCPGAGESATLGRPRKVSDGRPQTLAEQQRARTQSFGESFGEQGHGHGHHSYRSHPELISSSHGGGGGGGGGRLCGSSSLSLDREQSPLVDLVDSTVSSSSLSSLTSSCANSVVERPIHGAGTGTATATARRPDFLELAAEQQRERERAAAGKGGLGAPTWHLQRLTLAGEPAPDGWANDGRSTDFASLPCDAASPDEDEADGGRQANFKYRSPAYQSAHPPCRGRGGSGGALAGASAPTEAGGGGCEVLLQDSSQALGGEGRTGLLKWKGVVFTPEDDTDSVSSSPLDDTASQSTMEDNNGQVFTVELNRGWNSRLGFSLQNQGEFTVISAIYNDSVAAKNGKLKTGDRVIMVNDETVDGMPTPDVIDLFRKIRGPIAITVWREIQM